jgi:acetyl-CoA synthetase
MKWGESHLKPYNLSSLRLLGSVGEPINPEAWLWYHTQVGQSRCPIVDTWWQTETGGIMITHIPGVHDLQPGFAGTPLPGIVVDILDEAGNPSASRNGLLSITQPWPSMTRGIWGEPDRFVDTYWSRFPTYFAGDGALMDDRGDIQVLGRVDDVVNVAGHRLSTMEVESALVEYPSVAEAAVVGVEDEIKGQAIVAFVILQEDTTSPTTESDIVQFVGQKIGSFAKPKRVIFTPELPKTRSGKIMRRLLKSIANGQSIGDVTTLSNPQILDAISEQL